MRISSTSGPELHPAAQAADAGHATAPAPTAAEKTEIHSAVLQPARAALADMPAVDAARVAEIRDALARGELPFDASRLAALVMRYHGSSR